MFTALMKKQSNMAVKILYAGNKLSHFGLTPGVIETLGCQLTESGIDVFYAGTRRSKVLRFSEMIFKVIRLRKKVDYVLIDTYSTPAFWYAFFVSIVCRWFNLKYITVLHGGNLPKRLKRSPLASASLFKNSYRNVAVSGYLEHEFKIAGYNTLLIPNNIDIARYKFKKRENPAPRLLWVRSFHKQYNPLMAADVLAGILKYYPEAELCMVGPDKDGSLGDFRDYAKELGIDKKVRVTGLLSQNEWIQLSDNYDIFINTTNVDNTPVSVIEAMALGMAVVSTNVGGIPYLLENRKESLQSPAKDDKAMIDNVIELLNNSLLYREITINGRKKAESFDWTVIKHSWLKLLS
jgi:L-malate glycosyltransferase